MGNKDLWGGYRKRQHPRAMMYLPLRGMSTPDEYIEHLDQLDLVIVIMAPYVEHRHSCSFEHVRDSSRRGCSGPEEHQSRRPLMRLLLSRMESRGTWIWPKGWAVSETMSIMSCPVVWWRKGLMHGFIWKESWERFMEGEFIVVGVMLR
jgi:hypothetical protein